MHSIYGLMVTSSSNAALYLDSQTVWNQVPSKKLGQMWKITCSVVKNVCT